MAHRQCYHTSHDTDPKTFPKIFTTEIYFIQRWGINSFLYMVHLHISIELVSVIARPVEFLSLQLFCP
jgi:hypothetical protein